MKVLINKLGGSVALSTFQGIIFLFLAVCTLCGQVRSGTFRGQQNTAEPQANQCVQPAEEQTYSHLWTQQELMSFY